MVFGAVTTDIVIERGSILIYRMFDVAESIDLAALEARARAAAGTSRLRIARPGGHALIIRNAPVAVFLGDQDLAIGEKSYRCDVQARVWDYGVISFQFRVGVEALPWSALVAIAADIESSSIVEPSGARDLPDIIEFALTHLVEFRYYDDLLDEKLAKLYAAIGKSERRPFRTNYERHAREASALFMDLTEFIERVDNSLKVIGDYYLATIFRASLNRLRVHEWQANVT